MKHILSALLLCLPLAAGADLNPTNLRVTDLQATQATISWDASDAASYVVWGESFGSYGIIWVPVANNVTATSWTVYGLAPGTFRKYLVNAGQGCWPSPCQKVSFRTLTPPVWSPQPNDTTARVGYTKSVYLSFVASPDATIELLQAPIDMTISGRYLRWRPQAWQIGANTVQVRLSNSLGIVDATFTVTVK